jgi:hypothetical protein
VRFYRGWSGLDPFRRRALVPVERIELPTFGLQNRLPVNRLSFEGGSNCKIC